MFAAMYNLLSEDRQANQLAVLESTGGMTDEDGVVLDTLLLSSDMTDASEFPTGLTSTAGCSPFGLGRFLTCRRRGFIGLMLVGLVGVLGWRVVAPDIQVRQVQHGLGNVVQYFHFYHEDYKIDAVQCGADVVQSVWRVVKSVANFIELKYDCENLYTEEYQQNYCAGRILDVLYQLCSLASHVSASISDCPHRSIVPAKCAATAAHIMSSSFLVGSGAATVGINCDHEHWLLSGGELSPLAFPERNLANTSRTAEEVMNKTRKIEVPPPTVSKRELRDYVHKLHTDVVSRFLLNATNSPIRPEDDPNVGLKLTHCVADAGQAIAQLVRAAINIIDQTMHCDPRDPNGFGDSYKKNCAVDTIMLAHRLGMFSRYFSEALNDCTPARPESQRALCAAKVSGIIAGTMGIVGPTLILEDKCNPGADIRNER